MREERGAMDDVTVMGELQELVAKLEEIAGEEDGEA